MAPREAPSSHISSKARTKSNLLRDNAYGHLPFTARGASILGAEGSVAVAAKVTSQACEQDS